MTKFNHICEVCGKDELLTPEESFNAGWDYPPNMGAWRIISPRTCGDCLIDGTLWWALAVEGKLQEELTEAQQATLERILAEVPQ
jgi:hypothetical protein